MQSGELTEGQILANKYRVQKVLGSGGMGIVVSAVHIELDQRVAVKVLRADLASNDAVAERFRREARAACKITSQHGARVLDVGTTDDGLPYMVMEFLRGNDLAEELEQRGPLPSDEAASYVMQAADAIADAHDEGIIHRDLKPANLFLTKRGGVRIVKVLDFGISKSITDSSSSSPALTHTQALIGSPMYMSPEQLDSPRTVDGRTDIWSLGVVLYELVAGKPPFVAEGISGLIKQIVANEPPPLKELGIAVAPGFEAIIRRCLEKERTRRYASIKELMRDLAPYASQLPLSVAHLAQTGDESVTKVTGAGEKTQVSPSQHSQDGDILESGEQPGETVTDWEDVGAAVPKKRSWVSWTVGALSVLVGLGALFLIRGLPEAVPATTGGPGVTAQPNVQTAARALPEVEVNPLAQRSTAAEDPPRPEASVSEPGRDAESTSDEQPQPDSISGESEPTEPSEQPALLDSKKKAPATGTPAAPTPPREQTRTPKPPPSPHPASQPPRKHDPVPSKSPSGVTDFGGRH